MDTRPPPRTGGFGFNRVYRTNLRPLVVSVSALWSLWSLVSGIAYFRSISTDRNEGVSRLATFAIVLGAVFLALFAIEAIGVLAAALQRLALVRSYAYASFVAIALTLGGGVLQVIVHFTAKSDILKECTDLTQNSRFAVYPFGFFGPTRHETLNGTEAAEWCGDEYDRDSWQIIVSLLIMIFLSAATSMLAWGYYRQVLDPTSVVNFLRAPATQFSNNYPSHYNPPYNASVPNLGYAAPYANPNPMYAPPPGPPPARDTAGADGKGPGYAGGDGPAYGHDDKENPFADFDERTERDVTSRPGPGGRETF